MKYINKFIIILILIPLVFLSGCKKFLEENNKTGITGDVLYVTADGVESLVNSCYAPSRLWYGKMIGLLLTEAGTDEILRAGWGGGYAPYHEYNSSLQGTDPGFIHIWSGFYKGINACNAAIVRLPASPLAEATKKIREGEVRFLRAFYYYHLVETFGPLPIRTTETQSPEMTATRAPVEEVYKLIIDDLKVALENLSSQLTPAGGRVTKPGVEAFLARVYLTRKQYPEALEMADKVIKNYNFQMIRDYKALWQMGVNSNGNTNQEAIWFINYTADNTLNDKPRGSDLGFFYLWEGGHQSHAVFTEMNFGLPGLTFDIESGRPLNQYLPSLHLLDLYDETKDARYAGSFRTTWWANDPATLPAGIKIGDTIMFTTKGVVSAAERATKKYTIFDRNDVYQNELPKGDRSRYVQVNKFADPTRNGPLVHESKRDAIVFRLPEMYLIAAEASMYLNKKQEAADYINIVRTRAAVPGKEPEMQITASDVTIDFILDERAREFVGEQLRWFDLKRTGKLLERVKLYNPDAAPYIKEFHMLRPIPQVEIDVMQNKNEFTQNAGYN